MDLDTPVAESTPLPAEVSTDITESPEAPEPAESIADHAAQFGPEKPERPAANTGQFANKPPDARHRAPSQRATPEDVAEINRLTKELREAEQRIGEKDPDAKASPRIRTLKRQIAALKALEAPASTPEPVKAAPVSPEKPREATSTENADKEPEIEDFADDPDPYKAWNKAWNRWDRRQEAQQQAAQNSERDVIQRHHQRFADYAAKNADFTSVAGPVMSRELPQLLLAAIATDERGPEVVLHLAQHADVLDGLIFDTDQRAITQDSVAIVQRRLSKLLESGQAAQVPDRPPSAPKFIPPKPPNPVRTGPIKTVDDPPGETASIADHAKYYGPKR